MENTFFFIIGRYVFSFFRFFSLSSLCPKCLETRMMSYTITGILSGLLENTGTVNVIFLLRDWKHILCYHLKYPSLTYKYRIVLDRRNSIFFFYCSIRKLHINVRMPFTDVFSKTRSSVPTHVIIYSQWYSLTYSITLSLIQVIRTYIFIHSVMPTHSLTLNYTQRKRTPVTHPLPWQLATVSPTSSVLCLPYPH